MFAQTSLRRRLIALAAASLMFAVLVPVTPAVAATEACPSSIPSAGYKDLAGYSAETIEAVNCITYYGISEGVTAALFDPAGEVPRWQMALFLVRTAEDLGIAIPVSTDQGFNDLGTVSTAARSAINQLAQLGITKGVTATSFAPYEPVPRWQMALFLTRLYTKAGFTLPSGSAQGFVDTADLPLATWQAINQMAQLGVSKGTTPGHFGPNGFVYRWQMALFLARQLQACRAKPLTVSISPSVTSSPTSESVLLTVLVREADGSVVSGRYVDFFVGSLDTSKKCVLDTDASLAGGDAGTGTNCKIDSNDPKTNSIGVATVALTHANVQEIDTVYAWVGATGQEFDADEVTSYSTVQIQWTLPVGKLVVADKTAKYGTQVQVGAELRTSTDQAVPLAGQKVVFKVSRDSVQIITQSVNTGSNGVATLIYTGPADPTTGNDPTEVDTVVAFWDKDGDGVDDGAAEFDDTATVTWDDAEPRADSFSLTQSSVSGPTGAQLTLSMKVVDKFGVGYPNARVTFVVSGANGTTLVDDTDSSGTAQVAYTPTVSGIDTIDARIDFDRDGTIDAEDFDYGDVPDQSHYVVQTAPNLTDGIHTFDLLGVSASANAIDVVEIGTGNLYRLLYDTSNDLFSVDNDGKLIDAFETALLKLTLPALDGAGGVELRTNTYTTTVSGSSTFILETS